MSKLKSKKVKRWFNDHNKDQFVQKAQIDGYRSRAAYKLEEILQQYQLLEGSNNILDLGCAPGSWLQLLLHKAKQAVIVGVDLLAINPINIIHNNEFYFIQGDFIDDLIKNKISGCFSKHNDYKLDLIVSDMSPNLTGNKLVDQANIELIVKQVFDYSQEYLSSNGHCLIKLFHGLNFDNLLEYANILFKKVKVIKPKASKDKSKECYLLAEL